MCLIVGKVTVPRSKMNRPAIVLVYLTVLALATQETSGVSRENVYIDYSFRS
jgi:hypothetical protein